MTDSKRCKCDIKSALYDDMGIVKCQHCMGEVSKRRADIFIKENKFLAEDEYDRKYGGSIL